MTDQRTHKAARRTLAMLMVVLAACTFAATAVAQSPAGSAGMPPEAMLLQQMHVANQVQIKAAEIARHKATADLTRRLADRFWRDHQVADGKVRGLAHRLGYTLKSPAQMQQMMQSMPPAQASAMGGQKMQQMQKKMQMMQQMLANLQAAPAPQFDQAYDKAMLKSQQNMLQMLQQARTQASLPVKKLLNVLVPILEQHVALARIAS